MEISPTELRNIIAEAMDLQEQKTLSSLGILKPFITQTEAFELYGRGVVERWHSEGLITYEKDGERNSKIRIDRIKIELVAKTSNRASWYRNRL